MQVQIGELAKRSDCKVVTIRYYEKEGLLPEPLRSSGNYRLYDEGHLERLQFIRHRGLIAFETAFIGFA